MIGESGALAGVGAGLGVVGLDDGCVGVVVVDHGVGGVAVLGEVAGGLMVFA